MKIIFHEKFHDVYDSDPAATRGRMKGMVEAVEKRWEIVRPGPAEEGDILRCHTRTHLEEEREDRAVFSMAMLAAGGAVKAAMTAAGGENAFALIRPPGHHASPSSAWGFCHFNNVAVALLALESRRLVRSALILDIDLHFGDGTSNIFAQKKQYAYLHPEGHDRLGYMAKMREEVDASPPADIVAVSAGFDRGVEDWGNMLLPEDYKTIGDIAKKFALAHCGGKVFGVLEGGYDHDSLGASLVALLEGFEQCSAGP
jgi:acetoin utilization deacetylase AcuC-like enzyme